MRQTACHLLLVLPLICLVHAIVSQQQFPQIESRVNTNGVTELTWNAIVPGRYSVLLGLDCSSSTRELREGLFEVSNLTWRAELVVSNNSTLSGSRRVLQITPAIRSPDGDYFSTESIFEFRKGRVSVSLEPSEPSPFRGLVPRLCVYPMHYGVGQNRQFLWNAAYVATTAMAVLVLLVLRKRRS
jgi:hypothetical protein